MHQHEVTGLAGVDQLGDDLAFVVEFHVGLRDGVTILFPCGKIEREGLNRGRLLALLFQVVVDLLDLMLLHVIADLMVAVADIDHGDVVDDASCPDLPVGRLNEAVVVDPRIAAQRRNQADVRTLRRFNRADTAVVRGVNVADFESGALARKTARPKGGEAPLVRDLRQRVGLIHELRELR